MCVILNLVLSLSPFHSAHDTIARSVHLDGWKTEQTFSEVTVTEQVQKQNMKNFSFGWNVFSEVALR